VIVEEYIWVFNRDEHKDLTGSILGSLLFHTLMFAVLASTTIFHPPIGDAEKIDILWFYPSAPSVWRTEPAEKVALAPTKEPEPPPLRKLNAAAPQPEKVELPRAAPARATNNEQDAVRKSLPPSPPVSDAAIKPIVTVPPDEVPEPETEPEMTIPAAIEPLPEVKPVEPRIETPFINKATATESKQAGAAGLEAKTGEPEKSAPPIKKEVVAKVVAATGPPAVKETARPAVENAAIAPVTANRQQPAESAIPHRETTATAVEKQPRESIASAVPSRTATPSVAESAKGMETKTVSVATLPTSQPAGVSGEAKGEAIQKTAVPAPAAKPVPAAKAQSKPQAKGAEGKGIFLPPVRGDLKLEIVGKDDILQQIKVVVLFHELPRSRRNRPMSKAEYRRLQTLTPKLVRINESTRQAVIEVAAEGVYEFQVESGPEQPGEASFSVKLYDNSSRARTSPVGNRRIAGRESIVKVLMPEGLLWSDDSFFSGSIEDSESVTKFNTDTGIVWKEYK
jgi:hypothetical protein